ncbi:unnamed protein product, partial [Prorocentrum cordatum]
VVSPQAPPSQPFQCEQFCLARVIQLSARVYFHIKDALARLRGVPGLGGGWLPALLEGRSIASGAVPPRPPAAPRDAPAPLRPRRAGRHARGGGELARRRAGPGPAAAGLLRAGILCIFHEPVRAGVATAGGGAAAASQLRARARVWQVVLEAVPCAAARGQGSVRGDGLEQLRESVRRAHRRGDGSIPGWLRRDGGPVVLDLFRASLRTTKGLRSRINARTATLRTSRRSGSCSTLGEAQLHIEFGTGRIDGPQAVEDFHVGPFTVYNQTFGMIQVQDGKVFEEVPFEGILGLGFPSMSANGVTPFFDNVVKQKTLSKSEFSFYFSRESKAGNAVFWGGVDPAFYSEPIEYFHVDDPYYWSVPLLSFKIGNQTMLGEGAPGNGAMLE